MNEEDKGDQERMLKSYKTEINPTMEQIHKINKTIGTCRFVYNFILPATKKFMKKRRNLYLEWSSQNG